MGDKLRVDLHVLAEGVQVEGPLEAMAIGSGGLGVADAAQGIGVNKKIDAYVTAVKHIAAYDANISGSRRIVATNRSLREGLPSKMLSFGFWETLSQD